MQAPNFETHLLSQIGVEVGERLVEEQRLRLDHERTSKSHTLLLTTGQLARIPAGEFRKMRRFEDCRDAPGEFGLAHPPQGQPVRDIVENRHMRP